MRRVASRRCPCWPGCGPPAFRASELQKQFKYADAKGIPLVIVLGPEEIAAGMAKIKFMKTGTERVLPLGKVVAALTVE